MKSLSNVLMKGLAAVLPIGLTIYFVWWLATTAESLMHGFITLVIPEERYYPGMGILAGLLMLFAAGSLVNAYLARRLFTLMEEQMARIPVVKTVYSAVRDITRLLPASDEKRDLQSVVIYQIGEVRLLGFVTRDELPEMEAQAGGIDLVAVYFPMSYMVGGYTIFVPKSSVQPLDMPVEAAMRLALTGGMATTSYGPATAGAPVTAASGAGAGRAPSTAPPAAASPAESGTRSVTTSG